MNTNENSQMPCLSIDDNEVYYSANQLRRIISDLDSLMEGEVTRHEDYRIRDERLYYQELLDQVLRV